MPKGMRGLSEVGCLMAYETLDQKGTPRHRITCDGRPFFKCELFNFHCH